MNYESYNFTTKASHVGSVLGKLPVQISRNKSHKYRECGPVLIPPILL